MKNSKGTIWGIVLIILGITIALNSTGIVDINLFFKGWWTLFIIVPSFIGLINDDDKAGNIIGLLIGVLLLLNAQDLIDFSFIWKLIVPAILIIVGLSIIFKNTGKKIPNVKNEDEICSTFTYQNVNKNNEKFDGTNIDAIFGGVTLDLRGSKIKNEAVIKASAIFGGIKILVDNDLNVIVKNTCIFGGVTNKHGKHLDSKTTLYIDATAFFGGIEINEQDSEDD